MKRLAAILLIIAALGISSPFHILAQPVKVPHEDPAMAGESRNYTTALLLAYGTAFDLVANKQYRDAEDRLGQLKLADIPGDLQYLADRYNALSQELSIRLNSLDSLLIEVSSLLAQNQLGDARESLEDAGLAIREARFLMEDLETATSALGNKLGVFGSSATGQAKQAYGQLEVSLNRLRLLIDEFDQLRQSLGEENDAQAADLLPTELTMSISPASVFVGGSITATGRLTSGGGPLPRRELAILLDNIPMPIITTSLDGSYKAVLALPYGYVPDVTLTAEYVPAGDDTGTYQASKSPAVVINTTYYTTRLDTAAPQAAHPGLPVSISGLVSPIDGITARTIKVLLDGSPLAEETIRGRFDFKLEAPLPPQAPPGIHSMTVMVVPQGHYSGASKDLTIRVSDLPVQTIVQSPGMVVLPAAVQVSGRVFHNLSPVQDAAVSLSFKDSSSTVRTSADGSFTASLSVPLDLSTAGTQELMIRVVPAEAWYGPLEIKRRVFAVNPANTGLMLAILMSLGLVIYRRSRGRPQEETGTPRTLTGEVPPAILTPEPWHEPASSARGRILSAYISALTPVQKITGTALAPHATLREFLNTITPLLPAASKFAELTTITEAALYSAHKPGEETAIKAERLAASIEKELEVGTA